MMDNKAVRELRRIQYDAVYQDMRRKLESQAAEIARLRIVLEDLVHETPYTDRWIEAIKRAHSALSGEPTITLPGEAVQ